MLTILVVLLVLTQLGGVLHDRIATWVYAPSGALTLVVVILLALTLTGRP